MDEEKQFGLKSHLRACCTQPFNYPIQNSAVKWTTMMKSIILKTRPNSNNLGQKSLGHPAKTHAKLDICEKCLVLVCCSIYITLFWSLPSPFLPQAMLRTHAMILGVKGPSNQHCIAGGGGMCEFAVFLRKCPKTFGQDCSFHWVISIGVISRIGRKWNRSDSTYNSDFRY